MIKTFREKVFYVGKSLYLCSMKKFFFLISLLCALTACSQTEGDARRCIAFWNVENYFDNHDDPGKDDQDFTPEGNYHWTASRYLDKRNKIYKTLAALGYPAVMGLAEVENDAVLEALCLGTPLRGKGYEAVHYESPDKRGIDCALLYRKDCFHLLESRPIVVSDTAHGFRTRDILLVVGVMGKDDTCCLLVNHWPSKAGGMKANRRRRAVARKLRSTMDSLMRAYPNALVLAMGDFNAAPDEAVIRREMGFGRTGRNAEGVYNLMAGLPKGEGTYKYQGVWSYIDQMMASRKLSAEVFRPEFLLTDDDRYMGHKPFRTYVGIRYHGGYSDHLPIRVCVP